MKRFAKVYVEISNICNLSCSFCPGTTRKPKRMNTQEFEIVLNKIKPYTDYIYFHLLGEPLCHPDLEKFLQIADKMNFKVIITTNGTLLNKNKDILMNSKSHYKTVISLHSFEANDNKFSFNDYLENCFKYAKLAENKKIVVLRLWNNGGKDSLNDEILSKLENYFPKPWVEERNGTRIREKIYIQYGDKFDWPSLENDNVEEKIFCYGLRDQIGILADGTVVPCCLDNNGEINLGNIFEKNLEEIINSPKAQNIYNGFSNRTACEELCKRCSFVRKF
ncbi:MAG: SPASM domain-containing protein [Clostridia bacterium]|nr:SPASM domain-containing protein [Clostridia bacterium]